MSGLEFEPWEPEESVGKLWHSFVSKLETPDRFEDAAVTLDEVLGRLGVLFRGLGGPGDIEIRPAPRAETEHRRSWRRVLGHAVEAVEQASFDGEVLRLPSQIAIFPDRQSNVALYLWQTAFAVFAIPPRQELDQLRADIRSLQAAQAAALATLASCPGLRPVYNALSARTRQRRAQRSLPKYEEAVEATVCHLLGGPPPQTPVGLAIASAVRNAAADLSPFEAPRGYKRFEPVELWPAITGLGPRSRGEAVEETEPSAASAGDEAQRAIRAQRKQADQAARKDSLVLHKFESILSWAEFLNINRRIEDDDAESAKKAADDLTEVSLTRVPQKARTHLRLHLDLSPEEAEFERCAGLHIYPEWDHRTKRYLPAYCRVLAGIAQEAAPAASALASPEARRRIRNVRRQFEALRPKRIHLARQIEGDDIDLEAAVEARVELAATGEHSDRVYRASRSEARDLAISILLDASRSTESVVEGRQVLDIAREALVALAWGLDACGDEVSIEAFSSLRRDRVFVHACKNFDERMGGRVEARIAALRPGHYTRLGAAIRHASQGLAARPRQRRLLLVITDGKPNDLDHYEGRHGVEDTHMAVREARRSGQSVFGVTIDTKSRAAFARIFGAHRYIVVPHADKLTAALPQLYKHLVSQ